MSSLLKVLFNNPSSYNYITMTIHFFHM